MRYPFRLRFGNHVATWSFNRQPQAYVADGKRVSLRLTVIETSLRRDHVDSPLIAMNQRKRLNFRAGNSYWHKVRFRLHIERFSVEGPRRKGILVAIQQSKNAVQRYGLYVALLPMLAGFVTEFFPTEARSSSTVRKPPLAFYQYAVDLGQVEPKRDHFARFGFLNRHKEAIEIRKLETSCGCLSEHLKKRVFEPGEHGEFFLRVQSANQTAGLKSYSCKVKFGPKAQPDVEYETELTFKVTLPKRSVSVSPRVLIVHQLTPTRTVHSIEVKDMRDRQLNVSSVSCDALFAQVTLLDRSEISEEDSARGVIEVIQVAVENVPQGTHEAVVRVVTDDPEFNVLKVPLRVHGPNTPGDIPRSVKRDQTGYSQ